jgi:hypothetical protein
VHDGLALSALDVTLVRVAAYADRRIVGCDRRCAGRVLGRSAARNARLEPAICVA